MLFPTLTFGLFFLALYTLVWGVGRHNEWRKIILLVGSWIFYGAWDWRFVLLLMGSAILNFVAAWLISRTASRSRQRGLVLAGVVANLLILIVFKYYGFFIEQLGALLGSVGWRRDLPLLQVILPVGVSFFTFQGMSYLIDVYRGKCARASLLDVTLLMSFFAHLVAGPIVRGADLIPQFARTPTMDRKMAAGGLILIAWGLFKKTVIASQLASSLVDPVFFDPAAHGRLDLVAATYGYALQIYCDFSAYSDMAIGLAALLGYRFPRNFNQPYRASSLQDFWRRWHISLSSWLRDYLYISVGGSRGGLLFVCRNLMITMLLGGLWHGASWTFVIWGGLHGLGLCAERIGKALKPQSWPQVPPVIGWIVTFHLVCLAWIFFRSDSFDGAIAFLQGFGRAGSGELLFTPLALALMIAGVAIHATPSRFLDRATSVAMRAPAPLAALGLAIAIILVDAMRPDGVAPFIYFQF